MKYVYTVIVACCAFLASASVLADELEDFAQSFVLAEEKAWQEGEFDDLEALEDPNVVYYTSGGAVLTAGFAAHRDYIASNRDTLVTLDQEWEYLVGDGNVFSMSYRSTAVTQTQEITVDALFVFRLDNGRIVEVWTNGTTAATDLD